MMQNKITIQIFDRSPRNNELLLIETHIIDIESSKPMNSKRVAKVLASSGVEILPVIEKVEVGWRAWRLKTGDKSHSGFQPPLQGRTGKSNQKDNPFCDMRNGD